MEIPEDVYSKLIEMHVNEVALGNMSLTIEQFIGGFVILGYNWSLYQQLKKTFEK